MIYSLAHAPRLPLLPTFAQLPQTLFELLGIDYPRGYRFDSVELKQTAFRIDGVFVPPDPSGVVYFCEVQFQRDNTFYERFFAEIFLYLRLYRQTFSDGQAVVIYPNRLLAQRSQTETDLKQQAIIELIITTVLYKFTTLSREEVLRMLGFTTEELKWTRFYQD
ncbi:DUF2887 domain-containing protein [Thermosynechococcus sp. TG252]|nr:DUF2887 domain-containing protein [Thermosynechococcus sp. TG252]MDR7992639.1 DUF2887 domain-containing protein [Thermosynechococcus sp. TG252]